MATYTEVKQKIQQWITSNANREVTGQVMRDMLNFLSDWIQLDNFVFIYKCLTGFTFAELSQITDIQLSIVQTFKCKDNGRIRHWKYVEGNISEANGGTVVVTESGKRLLAMPSNFIYASNYNIIGSHIDSSFWNNSNVVIDVDLTLNTRVDYTGNIAIQNGAKLELQNDFCHKGSIVAYNGAIIGTGNYNAELVNDYKSQWFFCKTNIAKRSTIIDSATIYIDSIFGSDSNTGLMANSPKRTLQGARDLILSKCSTNSTDVVVNLRGGRYEISSTFNINFAQINSNNSKLIFKSNPGESVVISSNIRTFTLTESNKIGDWYRISKPDSLQYFHLVDENDIDVPLANSDYQSGNSELLYSNSPITLITKSSIQYAKIMLDSTTKLWLDSFSKDEIETWFITVPQWFTCQFAKINEYNSVGSYILYEIEQSLTEPYWNGYKYFNPSGKIPFWIYGKIPNSTQENSFWSDANYLYVKKKGKYITSDPNIQEGIKSTSTGKIVFDGISVKYFTDSYSNLRKNNFTGITNRQSVMTLLNQSKTELLGLEFKHCIQNAVLLYNQSDYLVYSSLFNTLGESGLVAYGTGSTSLCRFDDLSKISPHRGGLYADFVSNIKLNKFKNIGYTAIRFVLQPELLQTHNIVNNDIQDIGFSIAKKSKIMDGAAIYGYGSNVSGTYASCNVNENRIRGVKSDLYHRGIFFDDGVKNVNVFDNIILETDFYAIDIRQVGGITDNNNVYNNICQKSIRLEGFTASSSIQNNNVVLETDLQNKFVNTTTSTTKKIAYTLADKLKCKISDIPFTPKAFVVEWIFDEYVNRNLKTLTVEKINISTVDTATSGSLGVTANLEDYNLTAFSSGDRLVGRKVTGTFNIGSLSNVIKYLYEFIGIVAFTGSDNITSFTGKVKLAISVLGSKNSNDYSGIDFVGYRVGGNTSENPTGRIAVRTTSSGAYMKFGTSNSYTTGITNEGLSIDPLGNVGVGAETDFTKSIAFQIFTKRAFAMPRLTTTERDSLSGMVGGCEIFNTTINKKQIYNGTSWETITSA